MSIAVQKPKIIVVLGPTASGKSELAVKLAHRFNGEIISADSRQVYKGLDIGTGKIPRESMEVELPYIYKGIRHHLLDVVSPKKTFTVSQYQKLAKKALADILKRGKIPIICGGTGLYIDSIISGAKFPEVPPQPKLRKKLEKFSTEELFQKLQKLDCRRAKNIDKNNRRRLIRALEIILMTKLPVPPFSAATDYNALLIGIKKSPEELKKLIKKRLLKRLKIGMIEEVKNLHDKQSLSWKRLDNLGLEYRYISRYLRGLITKKEMIELILKESWQYAKRQMTWFKKDKNIIWIKRPSEAFAICRGWLDR